MRLILLLSCLILANNLSAADQIQVATSIRPIQLITDEILQGHGQSTLLIASDQSPHHFQLKPSQLKTVSKTDLLIWISDDFETGLSHLKNALPSSAKTLQLVKFFPASHLISDGHEIDGHIWLSPENVTLIIQLITQKLIEIDPLNQQLYLHNSLQLIEKITSWKQKNQQMLRGLQPRYILDHQFLAYFEKSFGIHNIATLRNTHDHGSSIKKISTLHTKLQQTPAKCLLIASSLPSKQAQQISSQHNLQIKRIKILDEDEQYESITGLLDAVANQLSSCQ